jgi:hypothetical protein
MSHTAIRPEKPSHVETEIEKDSFETGPMPEHVEAKTPSWFSRDFSTGTSETLADRYRAAQPETHLIAETPGPEAYEAYRRRLDEKFKQAQRLYDVPHEPLISEHRPILPLSDIHGRRRLYEQEQRAHMV